MRFNAGNAFVTVLPRFTGFQGAMSRQMGNVMPAAGRQAGTTFGKGVGQGASAGINSELPGLKRSAESAGKAVQVAAERSVKARDVAATAVGKLRVAEEQLKQLRDSGKGSPAKVAAAEEHLRKLRDSGKATQAQLMAAEEKLTKAREHGKATPVQLAAAEERVADAQRKVESTTRDSERAHKTYVDAMKKSTAATEVLQKATEQSGNSSGKAASKWTNGWRNVGSKLKQNLSKGVQDASAAAEKKAAAGGQKAGNGFSSNFKRMLAPLAGAVSVGVVLGKGWSRLTALDNARAKLKGLGNDGKAVEEIMANANAAVSGTAYGMDAAATTAAGAVAAGIKPGRELEGMLKGVANSAAAANIPMEEMGSIWNKVATTGKAQNDVLGQVADRGIPIYEALAKQLGVTADEVFSMASKGKIGFKEFEKAMTSASGTVADEMGNTVTGSLKNFMAAVGRVGANLMDGVFQHLGPMIQGITKALKPMEAGMKVVGAAIGEFLGKAVQGFQGIFDILVNGNFSETFRTVFGIEEDHPFVGFLFTARDVLLEVIGGVKAFGAAWVANDGDITSSGFPGFMERLAYVIRQGLEIGIQLLKDFGAWIVRNEAWLKPLAVVAAGMAVGMFAMVKAFQAFAAVKAIITGVRTAFMLLNGTMLANPIVWIVGLVVGLVAGFIYLWKTSDKFRGFFIGMWAGIKNAVRVAVDWVLGALSNMREFFTSAFGTASDAVEKSTSWISDSLARLKRFFADTWQGIKDTVRGAAQFVTDTFGRIATAVRDTLGAVFTWLYEKIVKPVWEGIKLAITIALTPIVAVGMALVWFYKKVLAPVFTWLYEKIVKPVWDGIRLAITVAWTTIKVVFERAVAFVRSTFAAVFTWLRDSVIRPVWDWIGKHISVWWANVKAIFAAVNGFVRGTLATVFTWLRDSVIKPVWNWIRNFISTTWTSIKTTFTNIRDFIRGTLATVFTWFRDSVIRPVWSWIRNFISTTWTSIKTTFTNIRDFIRGTLATVFTWLRDSVIKPVWDGIKNVISTVWTKGIRPALEGLRKFVQETLPDAFRKGVDFIEQVWKKVANVARKPINFIVETVYNNGLVKAFNLVADTIKLKDSWRLKPADPIPEFYAGGWTGPGSKYQEAGVVHADEFVVRKESQRSISRVAPGFLDALNQHGASALGYADGGLVRPVKGGAVTSRFGPRWGRLHAGVDWAVPTGTPVFAALAGRVLSAGWNALAGRTGIGAHLGHDGGRGTYYGHLSKLLVSVGDVVRKGQQIAFSGNTGNSTGPHLHFETHVGGKPVNPEKYLNGAALPEGADGSGGGWNPLAPLLNLATSLKDKFTGQFGQDNFMAQMAGGALSRLVSGPVEWVKEQFAKIGDFAKDTWSNVKGFFTGGKSKHKEAVRGIAEGYGWGGGDQWKALQTIIHKESSWDPNAANEKSSARGLFQKLTGTHGPIESTVEGQARWGLNYIKGRYGNPMAALSHHERRGWYANGGMVKPIPAFAKGGRAKGLSLVGEQGPELVNFASSARISPAELTAKVLAGAGLETQLAATRGIGSSARVDAILKSIEVSLRSQAGSSSTTYTYQAGDSGGSAKEFFETAAFEQRKHARVGGR